MNHETIRDVLIEIGFQVCGKVHHALRHQSLEHRTAVHAETEEDTIYTIDRDVEEIIVPALESHAEALGGIVLVAEGIGDEDCVVLPRHCTEEQAAIRVIMDPIDGTRGIMYDKRSAFYLAGAAPNKGAETRLLDIETAVMVELPTSRSYLSDVFWAIRGGGAHRQTRNLETGEMTTRSITPSTSKSILGGFAQISRFFPPGKDILAQIEEELIQSLFPAPAESRAILFEDQYICTGGQLSELLTGHDRFTADIRASLYRLRQSQGQWIGLTCHPYDISAHLIGTEAGLHITNAEGQPLNPPLDTCSPVDWVAYANHDIQDEVEAVFLDLLRKYGLIAGM
jgi:fructose-1,6-bisphosphatase/inositol monophosphatase family enzyme